MNKEYGIDTKAIQDNIELFLDKSAWYNVLDSIDFVTRRGSLDGIEIIIVESSSVVTSKDLIAYTVVHELDKYHEFDAERVLYFSKELNVSSVQLPEFLEELNQMTKHLSALKSFPTQDIKEVWRLFDPVVFGPYGDNELPISWYYGVGEEWQFCAFWHDH